MLQPHNKSRSEILGMIVSINTINTTVDIPICTSKEDIKAATEEDVELQMPELFIIRGWSHTKEAVYWLMRNELTMIHGSAMKSRYRIIPYLLQRQILEQLHSIHMGIEKTHLTRESVYWINMNTTIEQTAKQCSTCLEYQWTQLQ